MFISFVDLEFNFNLLNYLANALEKFSNKILRIFYPSNLFFFNNATSQAMSFVI